MLFCEKEVKIENRDASTIGKDSFEYIRED
jgi:hypothetical protein